MPAARPDRTRIVRAARARYLAGEKIRELAPSLGVPPSTLRSWLTDAGVNFRHSGADSRIKFDEQEMVRRYLAGASVFRLAKDFEVSRIVITHRLKERQVPTRTMGEQRVIINENMSAEQRKARARAANLAASITKNAASHYQACAAARQLRGVSTPKEARFAKKLLLAGIVTVPQYAIETFNVDLAIPDARIAIEVRNGWSYHGPAAAKLVRRRDVIEGLGWVFFDAVGGEWYDEWTSIIRKLIVERRMLTLQPRR